MEILYEDNHIIIVSKAAGEITQGDRTGDVPLPEIVKSYLKRKYHKPGDVFLGVVHRLDRPVSGLVVFARTGKALSRLGRMFASRCGVCKTYWAITPACPPQQAGTLVHWLTRDERANRARAYDHEVPGSKRAELEYRVLRRSERYWLLEITLHTGRHHQIRCQLSAVGCPIRGDLKYGSKRSLPDGSISPHARRIELEHPVSHKMIDVCAPLPDDPLWKVFGAEEEGKPVQKNENPQCGGGGEGSAVD